MGKKFKIITAVSSNEVSLCSKYNSGANKQTEFELVKDKQGTKDSNMKETIKKFLDIYEETEQTESAFKEFLEYWLQYDIDNAYYNVLSEALQCGISEIQYADIPKEEKEGKFKELFNMFIEEFKTLPITKTQEGKYEVSLVSKSHIQDVEAHPQNETDVITKENTSEMEKQEQLNVIQKAFETLITTLGLKKTETPADEQPATEEAPVEETVEETVEKEPEVPAETEEQPAEEETPVVEQEAEETVVEKAETTEEPVQEEVAVEEPVQEEVAEEVTEAPVETEEVEEEVVEEEPIEKTAITNEIEELKKAKEMAENELAELKKANEKMSFVQKAKDEYSMLSGTPEEIGEKLYAISKSNLDETSKEFVLEQLKKVSKENAEMVQEVGSITKNAENMTDEEIVYAKAKEIADAKGISINKALRQIK